MTCHVFVHAEGHPEPLRSSFSEEGLQPWQCSLQPEETNFATGMILMKLDGLLEAFMETNLEPLPKFRRGEARAPVNAFRSATIAEIEEAPEGCRMADIYFFNDAFYRNSLAQLFTNAAAMSTWAKQVSKPKVGFGATHSLLRRVACPTEDGPGMIAWLYDLFVAFQATRYSPNGEALDLLDPDVDIDHASMTVGDFIKVGSTAYMVGISGIYCLQLENPEPTAVRVEDYFSTEEQHEISLEEGNQSSPTASADMSGSSTALAEEESSENEEEIQKHYAMYMAPDASGWCRPKDRRALRAELSRHRAAMEAGQAIKSKPKQKNRKKVTKHWQPKAAKL